MITILSEVPLSISVISQGNKNLMRQGRHWHLYSQTSNR